MQYRGSATLRLRVLATKNPASCNLLGICPESRLTFQDCILTTEPSPGKDLSKQ